MNAKTIAHDGDVQMIDTSVVRVHQQRATGKGGGRDHCLGRFRCGFTTEIHARVDAQGRPIRPKLTAGLASDVASATELIGHLAPGAMLMAGDGNDAYALCALVGECGA